MDFFISQYGAVADGETMNTAALQAAIDACHAAGGGRVVVSGGTYLTGSVTMRSNVNLYLAADGVLKGSPMCEDYPEHEDVKHVNTARLPRWRNASMIFADECENISITGEGKIDCSGDHFVVPAAEDGSGWRYVRKYHLPTPPRAVFFTGCRNVRVTDMTIENLPAGWSFWMHDCDYVTFDRVKVIADVNYPNNDGIHINSSRNVTISNCSLTCGDDCIIVRANNASLAENKVCERVVVTNCNLTSYSAGIRIGWLNDGTIRNCAFSNIVMTDCTVGISVMLPYIAPNPDDPNSADTGREATRIENLTFSNIIMDKVCSYPIKMEIADNPYVMCDAMRNIFFDNLHVRGPELPRIIGRPSCKVQNISFTNCTFERTDGSEFVCRRRHGAFWQDENTYYPFFVRYVERLTMQNTVFDT